MGDIIREATELVLKYRIDKNWFIEDLQYHHCDYDIVILISDVKEDRREEYIQYLGKLFELFYKYGIDEDPDRGYYIAHPHTIIWDNMFNRDLEEYLDIIYDDCN